MHDSPAPPRELPSAVMALAKRCGATTDDRGLDRVVFTQTGSMRADAAHEWSPFRARQWMSLSRPAFAWNATTGPFGCVAITDALDDEGGKLTVALLGVIPLARIVADLALAKGELQRYLAELPLAPDAILRNSALDWEVIDTSTLRVAATHGGVRAHVDLTLGTDGLVASVYAPDRPRLEGASSVECP